MKIQADTIEELIDKCEYKKELFITLDKIISKNAKNLDRKLFSTNSITMIGYGFLPYKTSCYDGLWPIISIAPQSKTINLYIMLFENGKPVIQNYINVFGKSNVGKSCIRLKNLNEEKIECIEKLVKKVSTKKSFS